MKILRQCLYKGLRFKCPIWWVCFFFRCIFWAIFACCVIIFSIVHSEAITDLGSTRNIFTTVLMITDLYYLKRFPCELKCSPQGESVLNPFCTGSWIPTKAIFGTVLSSEARGQAVAPPVFPRGVVSPLLSIPLPPTNTSIFPSSSLQRNKTSPQTNIADSSRLYPLPSAERAFHVNVLISTSYPTRK